MIIYAPPTQAFRYSDYHLTSAFLDVMVIGDCCISFLRLNIQDSIGEIICSLEKLFRRKKRVTQAFFSVVRHRKVLCPTHFTKPVQ